MRRLTAAILCLTVALTGCYHWSSADPRRPALGANERTVRILYADSTVVRLEDARLQADTLIGWMKGGQPGRVQKRVVLPLKGTERVEMRELSVGKTALLVAPVAALTALTVGVGASLNLGSFGR